MPVIVIALLSASAAFAGDNKIHEEWVLQDIEFINRLKSEFKKDPLAILPLLQADSTRKSNLGYGYQLLAGSMGKGYVSTFYEIVYKNGKPAAYKLTQQMPGEASLKSRYLSLYAGMFDISANGIMPLYFNREDMEKPLDACDIRPGVAPEIREYMTPYSGTSYGERGGEANELLQNRAAYLAIKNSLNNDIYQYLLCSKNPASRLTAAEYFYSAKASAAELSPEITAKIDEIFAETPTITTLMGCMVTPADSRALVKQLSMHKAQSMP